MKKIILAAAVVLLTIASCSKKSGAPTASAPDGASVFSKNCARCHGAEGVKDERTPNLQTIAMDKAGLIKVITNGKNKMPSFEDKLSAAEIAATAELILSWHK
ncbi:MAG: cytochrome c [Bacteroidetes bacterium]|nr:cytochrome c [Bacteroidota bacterium]